MGRPRAWLHTTAGGFPATYWWLWCGTFVNQIGSFVWPFLAFYLTGRLHFSVAFTGLVLSGMGGASAIGAIVGGVLADRVGRRRTLFVAQLSAASATAGLGFARSGTTIAVLAVMLGFSMYCARPAFYAMVADVVGPTDRVRAYSLIYWVNNLAFAIAPVLAGLIAQHSYLVLFLGDAATTAAVAFGVTLHVRETRPTLSATELAAPSARGLRTVLHDRVFMVFVGLSVLISIVVLQHQVALPVVMRAHGITPAEYGQVIALNGVLIVLLQMPAVRLLSRSSPSRVLAGAALVSGVGFGLTAFAGTKIQYALTVFVWTLGEIGMAPTSSAVAADIAPVHLRGRYQGVYTLSWSLAGFLAPAIGGLTLAHAGSDALWAGCAVVGTIVAAGHLVTGPARDRRLAALRASGAVGVGEPGEGLQVGEGLAALDPPLPLAPDR